MNNFPKALVIAGPTASGKTALALHLAQSLPVEIISLDSALVYREMNIGTAKPSTMELQSVPHHLIDIISPLQTYSAADFVADCLRLCNEIHERQRLPLIVGGTMMYYHALIHGLNDLPEADASIRARLQAEKNQLGLAHLYQRLQTIDPITASRLESSDSQRIERALEVFELTGKSLSEHFAAQIEYRVPLNLHTIALIPNQRALLHAQIEKRFYQMVEHGLLDEVYQLQQNYPELTAQHTSMRCVGYRQAWDFLAQQIDKQEFLDKGVAATRQLAKRQLTWLRKLHADTIIDPYQDKNMFQTAYQLAQHHFAV